MKKRLLYIYVVLSLAIGFGCAERDSASLFAPSSGMLVIDGTLIVGQPFPVIFLSETLPANEDSPFAGKAVGGADMHIITGTDTIPYQNPIFGDYIQFPPVADSVRASMTYRIEVRTVDGRFLSATTTTPAPFRMDRWVLLDDAGQNVSRDLAPFGMFIEDSLMYAYNSLTYAEGLLEAWFRPTAQPGYQVGLFSLDPGSPLIIDPDFIDDEDLARIERRNASPVIESLDGKIRMPWFAIFFEGRYKIKVYTLDNNWYDYVRSNPNAAGIGFGGNAGDNFPEPIFHVDGGIGLFGSASVDSVGLTFLPRP